MKIEYNNLYTHFIFTTIYRLPFIVVNKVCDYILNQKLHYHNHTFAEEYEAFLKFYQQTVVLVK